VVACLRASPEYVRVQRAVFATEEEELAMGELAHVGASERRTRMHLQQHEARVQASLRALPGRMVEAIVGGGGAGGVATCRQVDEAREQALDSAYHASLTDADPLRRRCFSADHADVRTARLAHAERERAARRADRTLDDMPGVLAPRAPVVPAVASTSAGRMHVHAGLEWSPSPKRHRRADDAAPLWSTEAPSAPTLALCASPLVRSAKPARVDAAIAPAITPAVVTATPTMPMAVAVVAARVEGSPQDDRRVRARAEVDDAARANEGDRSVLKLDGVEMDDEHERSDDDEGGEDAQARRIALVDALPIGTATLTDGVRQMMRAFLTHIAPLERRTKGGWRGRAAVGKTRMRRLSHLVVDVYFPVLFLVMERLDAGDCMEEAVATVERRREEAGNWTQLFLRIKKHDQYDKSLSKRYKSQLLDASLAARVAASERQADVPAPLALASTTVATVATATAGPRLDDVAALVDAATTTRRWYIGLHPASVCGWAAVLVDASTREVVEVRVGIVHAGRDDAAACIGARALALQRELRAVLLRFRPVAAAFVEQYVSRARQSDRVCVGLGTATRMLLVETKVPYKDVLPQVWKKAVVPAIDGGGHADKAAVRKALERTLGARFPSTLPLGAPSPPARPGVRRLPFRHDASDALAIAVWGTSGATTEAWRAQWPVDGQREGCALPVSIRAADE